MTFVTLVRHGQTDWNLERRIQGWTDIPLNETGRRQARDAAGALADREWDRVVVSPLSRATETGEIIAGRLGLPAPTPEDGLRERAHGAIEGLTFSERQARFPGSAEVPGMESRQEVVERVERAFERIEADGPEDRVIVVSHGGVIGSLLRHVSGGRLPAAGQIVANGSQHDFLYADGRLELLVFRPAEADPDLDDDRPPRRVIRPR